MSIRVVVTGVGLKTALGADRETTWMKLLSGESGLETFRTGTREVAVGRAGGSVLSFALTAAREALSEAGLDPVQAPCACVAGLGKPVLGSGDAIDPCAALASYLGDDPAMAVSRQLDLSGPALAVSAACATGAIAVGLASEWIREGRAGSVLVVCADAPVQPLYIAGFQKMGVLASVNGTARHSVRPFDRRRTGFGLGEGAAAFLLESERTALRRGGRPWAVLSGFAQSTTRSHPVRFGADDASIATALERAAAQGGCRGKVDYLNCHGTATPLNDVLETRAIKKAFGRAASGISLSSTKASTGHLLSAAGAVEAAFAVLSLRDGRIPPTLNLEEPDPDCDLDFTPLASRSRDIRHAMSLSFGFGGAIGALVFSRC